MSFSCETPDENTRAFMRRIGFDCREPIGDWTIPFYAMQCGDLKLCGSGVLLEIGDKQFIVTAAHTFDVCKAANVTIEVITDGLGGPKGEIVLRSSVTSDPIDRLDDPYDFSVCELAAGMKERISGGKRFLHLNNVDPWDKKDPRSWYMVFGYPSQINPSDNEAKRVRSNVMALSTFLYCGERGEIPSLDKEAEYLLDFNPAATIDDAGDQKAPFDPHGMSGCGIWRLAEAGCSINRWKPEDVKLVGIQNAWKQGVHLLRGTRIRYALQFIYRNHEDLRPAMDWHFNGQARNL